MPWDTGAYDTYTEIPDSLGSSSIHRLIGISSNLLVQLVALRLEHLEQAPFGFLVIGLDEVKAFAGDECLGLFTPCEGQEALPGDDLKPALRALGADVPPHRCPR
jgi:hypothetical protein